MALKFDCTNCGQPIIVAYLKPGETAVCRNCGNENIVPQDAAFTDGKATLPDPNIQPETNSQIKPPPAPVISIDDLAAGTASLFRKNAPQFLMLASVTFIINIIFDILIQPSNTSFQDKIIFTARELILGGIFLAVIAISQIPMIIAAKNAYKSEPIDFMGCYRESVPIIIPYLLTSLLLMVALGLFAVCLIIPGIIALIWFNFTIYLVVTDRIYYFKALSNSRALSRGRWWKVFIRVIPLYIIIFAFSYPVGKIQVALMEKGLTALSIVITVGYSAVSSIIAALWTIYCMILLYNLKGDVTLIGSKSE